MALADLHIVDELHREAWEALAANVQRMLDHLRPPAIAAPSLAGTVRLTALERAFQLASSGQYRRVAEIERVLRHEGHSAEQLEGPLLRRQLRAAIAIGLATSAAAGHSACPN